MNQGTNLIKAWIEENIFGNYADDFEPVIRTEQELRETAFHEAGHFIVNKALQMDYIPIIVITIVPTKEHFGVNYSDYIEESVNKDEKYYIERIAYAIAGKIASEQMGFEPAFWKGDFIKAIDIAEEYIQKYCPYINNKEEKEEKTIELFRKAGEEVKKAILENKEKLEIIAEALLFRKILLGEEAQALYDGTLTLEELEPLELD